MAEERNLSLARTTAEPADEDATDATKAELQRRMDEARESITHTVTEIKETVMNQYQQVRESISDSLDWREQYRRRPVPFTVGAFGVGLVLGYGIANAVKGDGAADDDDYDTDEAFDRIEQGFDRMQSQPATRLRRAADHAAPSPSLNAWPPRLPRRPRMSGRRRGPRTPAAATKRRLRRRPPRRRSRKAPASWRASKRRAPTTASRASFRRSATAPSTSCRRRRRRSSCRRSSPSSKT